MAAKLHYQTYGEGRPVIILHGLFGSSRNWTSFAKKLSEDYQVIAIDLRNHGKSEHADTMTYPEMASDIADVLEESGLEKASLVGHSMGGKVAMTFALQNRSMIDQLIVLDVAPISYQNEFHNLLDAMDGIPLSTIKSRSHADALLTNEIPDASLRMFLLQNLQQDGDGYYWRVNLGSIKKSLIDISSFPAPVSVNSFEGKVLFLSGDSSDYVRPQHHPIIRQYFSRALIHTVKDAGHWLHADQPDKVLEKIKSFLNDDNPEDPPSLLYGR